MFFVKTRLNANKTLITNITDQNVFTHCPDCGAEVQVDLSELVYGGKLDLVGTSVCCKECSKRLWESCDIDDDDIDDDDVPNQEDIDVPALLDHLAVSINCLRWALQKKETHGDQ